MHSNEPQRITLAHLPTPIVELGNLAEALRVPRILMKRDDFTGFETSGNKIRKLEYVVADASNRGADTLVTHGGFQSNHCRATAAVGAKLGLKVRLLLRSTDLDPARDGNLFLDELFGADISYHSPEEYNGQRNELMSAAMEAERAAGRKPYFFPVGASIPLGCWGYIRCMSELVEQVGRETKVDVFCAVGSGGTHAGLVLGKALFGLASWRVVGVPICDSVALFQRELRDLVDRTIHDYGLGISEGQTPIELMDGFIGEGYGIPYSEAIDTLRLLARREGVVLDPTYTAKGFAGLLAAIHQGGLRAGATPLFLHTGGGFGLMAQRMLV